MDKKRAGHRERGSETGPPAAAAAADLCHQDDEILGLMLSKILGILEKLELFGIGDPRTIREKEKRHSSDVTLTLEARCGESRVIRDHHYRLVIMIRENVPRESSWSG